MVVLENLRVVLDPEEMKKHLRIRNEELWEIAEPLIEAFHSVVGRAVYRPCFVESRGDNFIVLDGVVLTSKVLRKNAEGIERLFPYVVTIGNIVEETSKSCEVLGQYYCSLIGDKVLRLAKEQLIEHLQEEFGLGELAFMSPGSLPDWPLPEQKPLFSLLGDVETAIGVKLNESCAMQPNKSVSGVLFPNEISFASCRLCTRERCPSRRAPYDKGLAAEYRV
jgi:hypothetical protein